MAMQCAFTAQDFWCTKKAAEFDERSCVSTSVGDDTSSLDEVSSQPSMKVAKAPCTLVWCHERCHKQESEEMRSALGNAAPLVCLKKATKFANWCHRSEGQPYVLLTDWREVKPCLAHLAAMPASRCPVLTIVYCDDAEAKIFTRAAAWARCLGPEAGTVRVVQDLESVQHLLQSLRGNESSSAASSPCSSRQPSKASQAVSLMQSMPEMTTVQAEPFLVATRVAGPSYHNLALCPDASAAMVITSAWLQPVTAPYGALNAVELENLLKSAAPAVYED